MQGEENMKRIEEDGRLVAVLEKRAISAQREGYFIVQVCSMCVCVLSPQVIRVQMYSVHVHVHVVYMYIECTCTLYIHVRMPPALRMLTNVHVQCRCILK